MKKTTLAMAMMVAMGWQAPALAEMTMEEKNRISHRGLALNKLVEFLHKWSPNNEQQ